MHLKFEELPGKYTKIEARRIEQLLIEKYSTLNKGNPMNNQINGIIQIILYIFEQHN